MPIEIAPNQIELSDLMGGWAPDPSEAGVPMDASPDTVNLLPIPYGNELRLRHGFARPNTNARIAITTHWIRHVYYYETIDSFTRKKYLMCVLSTGADATANNIMIYAYDLTANTFTRVDTVDRAWTKANRDWWFAVVEGTFYAGTRREAPISWHPTDGYSASPTTPSVDTWVDSISPGASQKARDYAYKKGDGVLYSAKYYKAAKDIRYATWESGQRYSKGNKVSRKTAIGGYTYWRSYECILSHTASSGDAPGTGASEATYWKKVRLQNILDDDSEITKDWFFNPIVAKTGCAAYHGFRLFARRDDDDNYARVQYSAPAKPEKGAEIADLDWDPTDWAAVDDNDGDGGGWFTVPFSGKGDGIRAMYSFGNYLIIAGRWQSYVLAGTNEATWTLRKLGNYGALSNNSICELDGLVYMLDRKGVLVVTDGTSIQPVPGMEKIRIWLKDAVDDVLTTSGNDVETASGAANYNWFVNMQAHNGFIWITLPVAGVTSYTLLYDPRTQSFWKLDIPMLDLAVGEAGGAERLWFSTPITAAGTQRPCVFKYTDDPGQEAYVDDDWQAVSASTSTTDITWNWRSAWFQFGMRRQERRIRRAWATVGGEASSTVVVRLFRNFVNGASSYFSTVTRTLTGQATNEAEFVEAKVGQTGHMAYAEAIRLSGTANAAVSVHGVGLDTEPVRTRFHK